MDEVGELTLLFRGHIRLNPSQLEEGITIDSWYKLESRNDQDVVSGEIRVSFTYQSETMLLKQKALDTDKLAKDSHIETRKKTLVSPNIGEWTKLISDSEEPAVWLEASIELYEWLLNDLNEPSVLLESGFVTKLTAAARYRVEQCPKLPVRFLAISRRLLDSKLQVATNAFWNIVCGIFGKLADLPGFQEVLYREKADQFCFDQIRFATPEFHREARQSCLLLLLPYFSFFSQRESSLSVKIEKSLTPSGKPAQDGLKRRKTLPTESFLFTLTYWQFLESMRWAAVSLSCTLLAL